MKRCPRTSPGPGPGRSDGRNAMCSCALATAMCAERPGRKLKLASETGPSQSACTTACWMTPRARVPPDAFGCSGSRRAAPVAAGRCRRAVANDRWPMVFEVGCQIGDGHPVRARRTLAALDLRQRLPLSRSITLSINGPQAAGLSTSASAATASVPSVRAAGLHPSPPCPKASSSWVFCRLAMARKPRYLPLHAVRAFGIAAYHALGWLLRRDHSPDCRTRQRPPEVSSTAFPARPPDLPPGP